MDNYYKSPLNYTGGKYKLLPQILPLFPEKINVFYDLFCGGCNVGLNINANKVIYNDINQQLIDLYHFINDNNIVEILNSVEKTIDHYKLSKSNIYGYEHYHCNSSKGLGPYNRNSYMQLRTDFNSKKNKDFEYYIFLYVLIVYAFNNQIRFNNKGDFNLPVGKRDFNNNMKEKLTQFSKRIHEQQCTFTSTNFSSLNIDNISIDDFVYADPPYLITCASYNENNGWTENEEKQLLQLLDTLTKRSIKFALSNVLKSKGQENSILIDWLNQNKQYKAISLSYTYSNSNYQRKQKELPSDEVLIINY